MIDSLLSNPFRMNSSKLHKRLSKVHSPNDPSRSLFGSECYLLALKSCKDILSGIIIEAIRHCVHSICREKQSSVHFLHTNKAWKSLVS